MFDRRNKRKLHNYYRPLVAVYKIHLTLPASGIRLPTVRRTCHFCSAGLQPSYLIIGEQMNFNCA